MTTQTDRELLELAAKAAGLGRLLSEPHSLGRTRYYYRQDDYPSGTNWNPLTDDGDALRLAVKLQFTVCNEHVSSGSVYCTQSLGAATWMSPVVRSGEHEEEVISEDYAATRRAIVRAAAAIGSAM